MDDVHFFPLPSSLWRIDENLSFKGRINHHEIAAQSLWPYETAVQSIMSYKPAKLAKYLYMLLNTFLVVVKYRYPLDFAADYIVVSLHAALTWTSHTGRRLAVQYIFMYVRS